MTFLAAGNSQSRVAESAVNPQHQSGTKCKAWLLENGKQTAGRENALSRGSKLPNHPQSSHVELRCRNHCRKPILTSLSYGVNLCHAALRNHRYSSTVLLQVSGQGGTTSPHQLLPICQSCPPCSISISIHHCPQLLPQIPWFHLHLFLVLPLFYIVKPSKDSSRSNPPLLLVPQGECHDLSKGTFG